MAPPPVARRPRGRSSNVPRHPVPPPRARDEESKLDGKSSGRKKLRSGNVSVDGFDMSKWGSNALSSDDDSSEGESEVMMRGKRGKVEKEEMKKKKEKRSDLVLISDSDEEEGEKEVESDEKNGDSCSDQSETESSNGINNSVSSDVFFSSEDEIDKEKEKEKRKGKEKESESESLYLKKQRKNETEKKEKKGKEKMTKYSESVSIRKATSNKKEKNVEKEKEKKGKLKQTHQSESLTKQKGKEKQTESATKQKGKEKEKEKERGAKSESVQTGWDTYMRESEMREKKKERKPNPRQICIAMRTRSYSAKKDPKKDNCPKINIDSDKNVYYLDSDSQSESKSESGSEFELGLTTIHEEGEEEESDSDSDSDSYLSESKEVRESGSRGESFRERKKHQKAETSRKRRRREYEREEREVSSDSDELGPLDNGASSESSMDEMPLTERMEMDRETKKERTKHKERKERKKEEKRIRKERKNEEKERKRYKARDTEKRDPQKNKKSNSERKNERNRKKREKVAGREDLMEYLLNNMNNEEEEKDETEEIPESSRRNLPQELPMVFDWPDTSDDEPNGSNGSEKSLDELWKDYDFALEVANLGTYNADEAQDKNEEFYKANDPDFCENGAHQMYLDEQIGYRCLLCSYVETEIRHVMPDFAKNAHGPTQPKTQANINDLLNFSSSTLHEPGPSRTKTGTVWDLIPNIYQTLYPHQKEAFEFMWQNIAGSIQLNKLIESDKIELDYQIELDQNESERIGGCVVSHAPGTGKTRLAIVFIESFMRAFDGSKPVVIAPAGMMQTWENEFMKWGFRFPFHNLNSEDFTGKEDEKTLKLTSGMPKSKDLVRQVKLCSWAKGNCVLGISYSLFSKFMSQKSKRGSKEREMLIEKPGLLVLDEGHIPRNDRSLLWNAFSEVKTEKRIILSGTPFQNNFLELYNSLCIVRPKFAQKVDVNKEERKKKGMQRDVWFATRENITDEMVGQAREILMPFVHVHAGSILQSLPGLKECVIVLKPEPLQKEILEKFIGKLKNYGTFETDHRMCLASVHPFLLTRVNHLSENEKKILDVEMLKTLKNDPYEGVKTKFVVEFVRLCDVLKERVLIFSQYLEPLKLIRKHLLHVFNWIEGSEVLQIYGRTLPNVRQGFINKFNDMKSEARVLLASTKACSEGISLTGASRVVMLDVVWNPSVGKQAISRAFRIGQEKVVYTYNLICEGTREMDKYDVQGKKEMLSKLVFAPKCEGGKSKKEGFLKGWSEKDDACKVVSDDRVLEEIAENEKLRGIFADICYIESNDLHD